ncbi:hypothetical protein M0811_06159 [Anaeramoeba ignava]|uniref:Uncharacterized protein n=1 Tax=Anaeramoeba ignava TaxID=1746090 RepID=A0A9Q0LQ95_ANAIG|nr:hypothetical protein M0811_06159 [Anaeramoeba ignava]
MEVRTTEGHISQLFMIRPIQIFSKLQKENQNKNGVISFLDTAKKMFISILYIIKFLYIFPTRDLREYNAICLH